MLTTQLELPKESEASRFITEKPIEPTPMMLIQAALESGTDPDKLEKLMALQERWDATQERKAERAAEVAFNKAMSECQAAIEPVKARLKNTQTNSLYADLCAIDDTIRPIYTAHGFSICEGTTKSEIENHTYVYIDVLHSEGHSKRYGDDFPLDSAGIKGSVNKTPIHAKASTTSYARRYLITGVFNIAIARTDRDGNANESTISEGQVAALNKLLDKFHPDDDQLGSLCEWASIETLDQLPVSRFNQAKQGLEKKLETYKP